MQIMMIINVVVVTGGMSIIIASITNLHPVTIRNRQFGIISSHLLIIMRNRQRFIISNPLLFIHSHVIQVMNFVYPGNE
jgi:hypothetical protein